MKLAGVIPLPGTALRDDESPGEASTRRMLDFTTGRGVDITRPVDVLSLPY
jgi:hypothetical protein